MKAIVWKNEDLGAAWEEKEIPEDLKEISKKYRTELVETAVEQDEKLMESYLNGEEIKEQDFNWETPMRTTVKGFTTKGNLSLMNLTKIKGGTRKDEKKGPWTFFNNKKLEMQTSLHTSCSNPKTYLRIM